MRWFAKAPEVNSLIGTFSIRATHSLAVGQISSQSTQVCRRGLSFATDTHDTGIVWAGDARREWADDAVGQLARQHAAVQSSHVRRRTPDNHRRIVLAIRGVARPSRPVLRGHHPFDAACRLRTRSQQRRRHNWGDARGTAHDADPRHCGVASPGRSEPARLEHRHTRCRNRGRHRDRDGGDLARSPARHDARVAVAGDPVANPAVTARPRRRGRRRARRWLHSHPSARQFVAPRGSDRCRVGSPSGDLRDSLPVGC